ncbi:acyl-CoA thioesterase [Alphaproteobacteria bacterium GH1-50]|uniref:Acyl-CoA thioesterase n=1 Tax=Kangsaoukella pontilimi TaxID=2691042 RepID=A0A7C9MJM8_9RHOB|nr:thioesterase family protein [Kangsaoukella pontilimi]MXQ07895.1 acyl-CoA thioesterase [Kangsaoukella pontilimi]
MSDPAYLDYLDGDALTAAGLPGWPFGYRDRVRFHELDALNHVNNVIFLRWFETIRVAYVKAYGLTDYSHTDSDPQLVVRHVSADYLSPMYQDENYLLTARTTLIKPSSFVMAYAVHVDGALRATGTAVVVSLEQDGRTRRPHRQDAIDRMVAMDSAEKAGF